MTQNSFSNLPPVAFIGGGNMASAIIGGLRRGGLAATSIEVVEPFEDARAALQQNHDVVALPGPTDALARCALVVWAVKPQVFAHAAAAVASYAKGALHLSVAAGIPSDSIAAWLGTQRIVRAMPNTPALIGKGMTGLFARPDAGADDRRLVEQVLATTGELLWVDDEALIDAVIAVSGSGPAYVFYFIEAITEAGVEMGLSTDQAHRLAVGTFTGASALASGSAEPPAVLRQRVTSKGGTTHAAITSMEQADVKSLIKAAARAAQRRAGELAEEFGKV